MVEMVTVDLRTLIKTFVFWKLNIWDKVGIKIDNLKWITFRRETGKVSILNKGEEKIEQSQVNLSQSEG